MYNAYSETLPNVPVCLILPGHGSLFDPVLPGPGPVKRPVLLEEGSGPPLSLAAPLSITFLCCYSVEGQLSKRATRVPRTIFKF